MPFLSEQKNWRAPRPPSHAHFSPKSPDQNSEIAILFTIVEKPNNYVFGDHLLPRSPRGRGPQVTNFDLCSHIVMVTGKCTDVFRGIFGLGGGELRVVTWEDLSMEELLMGEETFNGGGAGFSSIT